MTFDEACEHFGLSGQNKAAFAYYCKRRNALKRTQDTEKWGFLYQTFVSSDNHRR